MPQTKQRITGAQILEDLYKNARMGVTSTLDVLGKVTSEQLRAELTSQIDSYESFSVRASKLLGQMGVTPKEESAMTRMGAKIGVMMNTMSDATDEHIAEMMIQGLTMGITDIYRDLGEAEECGVGGESVALARELLAYQELAVERLKKYL